MQTQNWDTSLAKLMWGVRFSPPAPTYLPVRCLTASVLDQAGTQTGGQVTSAWLVRKTNT